MHALGHSHRIQTTAWLWRESDDIRMNCRALGSSPSAFPTRCSSHSLATDPQMKSLGSSGRSENFARAVDDALHELERARTHRRATVRWLQSQGTLEEE
jgi:hypothetical protein